MYKYFRAFLFALLTLFLTSLLVEAGLRLLKPHAVTRNIAPCIHEENESFGYGHKPNSSDVRQVGFEFRNTVKINSLGFHDVEHAQTKEPGKKRILVVGDSFTIASEVPIAQGWTRTMARDLGLDKVEVVNAGISGTGIDTHLRLMAHFVPRLQPDIVLLAFFENDFEDIRQGVKLACYDDHLLVFQTEEQKEAMLAFLHERRPSQVAYTLAHYSYFYRALMPIISDNGFLLRTNSIAPGRIGMALVPPKELPSDYGDNTLHQMKALTEEHGATLIIMPIPGRDNPENSMAVLRENVSAGVLSQLPIIDVYPALRAVAADANLSYRQLYFVEDSHFNARGYQLLGVVAADAIRPYLETP